MGQYLARGRRSGGSSSSERPPDRQIGANNRPAKSAKPTTTATSTTTKKTRKTTTRPMAARILMTGRNALESVHVGLSLQPPAGRGGGGGGCGRDLGARQVAAPSSAAVGGKRKSPVQPAEVAASSKTMRAMTTRTPSQEDQEPPANPKEAEETPEDEEKEALLFTSLEQLCGDIIARRLLRAETQSALCLFVFGCPGSQLGELQFELAEHSSLLRLLDEDQKEGEEDKSCPLYHLIDAAALIVANIDARIREYNWLKSQSSRLIGGQQHPRLSSSCQNSLESKDEGEQEEDGATLSSFSQELGARCPSMGSGSDQQVASNKCERPAPTTAGRRHPTGQTHLTLNTKQRSILQLKLVRYFNSVTSKWVLGLIQRQVELLEAEAQQLKRPRVYLISLVPNQLSLFKSCLYLDQNIYMKEFTYPYWALKFQRRTNIRLLKKERPAPAQNGGQSATVSGGGGEKDNNTTRRQVTLKLGNIIRLPLLSQQPTRSSSMDNNNQGSDKRQTNLKEMAESVLSGNLNEKLGPKYNENFVHQFKLMRKLLEVRYNPKQDTKYAVAISETEAPADHPPSPCSGLSFGLSSSSSSEQQLQRTDDVESKAIVSVMVERAIDDQSDEFENLRLDRQVSASMQHLDAQASDGEPKTASQQPRLSLSKVSPQPLPYSLVTSAQLSPSQNSMLSSSAGSSISLLNSTSNTNISDSSRQNLKFTANNHGPIKWAVELQLYDSSAPSQPPTQSLSTSSKSLAGGCTNQSAARHSNNRSPWRSTSAGPHAATSKQMDKWSALTSETSSQPSLDIVYQRPTKGSSPLMFGHQRERSGDHYRLVPVRIAYQNERTQVVFEAKRVGSRRFKLKGPACVARVKKQILKAKHHLVDDCVEWLYDAISSRHELTTSSANKINPGKKRHSLSTTARQQQQQQPQLVAGDHQPAPVLIVYTICLDVHRLLTGQFQYPGNFQLPPQLMAPPSLKQPATKQAPTRPLVPILAQNGATGGGRDTTTVDQATTTTKQKRHVQFKLREAPSPASELDEAHPGLRPERRHWLEASVFISSPLEQAFVQVMEQVAALMKLDVTN